MVERNIQAIDYKSYTIKYPIQLSNEEQIKLEELKILLINNKNDIIIEDNIINNDFLIRFLKANKLKPDKSFENIMKYTIFRKKYRLDDENNSISKDEENNILLNYPQFLHKTDKNGRPVLYDLVGKINFCKINLEKVLLYKITQFEYIINKVFPYSSQFVNKRIDKITCIVDLKNFNSIKTIKNLTFISYIKKFIYIAQNYYPDILGLLVFINSNNLFKALWTVIKEFLNKDTKAKVYFYGKNYKEYLLKNVSSINLINLFHFQNLFRLIIIQFQVYLMVDVNVIMDAYIPIKVLGILIIFQELVLI